MMGRMTLREIRDALAAAKARGAKTLAKSPTVEELESLVRLLERETKAGVPVNETSLQGAAEQDASADGGGRRGSRRTARARSPRRR
jgi:hypothetical protein